MTDDLAFPDDDLDDGGLDPADETFEETRKRLIAEYGSSGEGDEDGEAKALSSDPAVALLERFGREPGKSDADLTYEAQLAEAEALIAARDGVLPPHEDTDIERLAVKAAGLSASELGFFAQQLADANEKQAREMRAGSHGFDSNGDPAPDPEPAFDPMTLDQKSFRAFQEAVISGGPKFGQTPAGFTDAQWAKAIDSALGR